MHFKTFPKHFNNFWDLAGICSSYSQGCRIGQPANNSSNAKTYNKYGSITDLSCCSPQKVRSGERGICRQRWRVFCSEFFFLFIFFYCTNKPLFFPWYFIIFVLALKFCTLWIFFWVLRGYTCRGLTKQSPRSPAVFGQCRVPNFILHLGSNRCTIKK